MKAEHTYQVGVQLSIEEDLKLRAYFLSFPRSRHHVGFSTKWCDETGMPLIEEFYVAQIGEVIYRYAINFADANWDDLGWTVWYDRELIATVDGKGDYLIRKVSDKHGSRNMLFGSFELHDRDLDLLTRSLYIDAEQFYLASAIDSGKTTRTKPMKI